jgi:hypothetical protein
MIMESRRCSSWDTSCRLAPVTTSARGTPAPSTRMCRRTEGSCVAAYPRPINTGSLVVCRKSRFPQGFKKTGGNCGIPGWENQTVPAGRSRGYRYEARKRFPQAPCAAVRAGALPRPCADIPSPGLAAGAVSAAPPAPKTHPLFPMNAVVSLFPSVFFIGEY